MILERYLSADLSLFLFFILLMIFVILRHKKGTGAYQQKLFMAICLSTMAMMVLDVTFRFANGGGSRGFIYLVSWLYFLVEPIPMILWLCYLDFFLFKSMERLRKRLFYSPFFFVILFLMVLNFFTNGVFYIDGNHFYQRGPLIPVIVYFNLFVLVVTIVVALKRKKNVGRRVFVSLVMFGLIPLAGNLLQFLFVGTILIWPSVSVAVVFVYLFLESQRERKDYLTGLLNRQQIDDIIQERLSLLGRKGGFTLVMIDLDDFKSINDNFGHKEGDRALVQASEFIYSSVRSVDRVARFGGDEFIVLLEEVDREEVEKVIERISLKMSDRNGNEPLPYKLAVSCGYKIVPPDNKISYYDLIHEADREMYRIKKSKKAELLSP
ncbi:MAG: GGDEF domain-containing protein [Spirochaetales bacterium]|nr:GGDEF domain-containing protein [Spirochaetales bacterium]